MTAAFTDAPTKDRVSVGPAPAVWDVAVVVFCVGVTLAALSASDEPGARPPDAAAVVLLVAASAPLLVRRRWPVPVAAVTGLLSVAYLSMSFPGGPSTLPVLVALYAVAVTGHRWSSALTVLVFAGGGVAVRALVERDPPVAVLLDAGLYVVVALFGEAVYSRRALRTEVRERLRAAASERDKETQRRVAEERLRIARDLHDVIAHTITSMSLQAAVAADVMADRPEQARAALARIRHESAEAVQELRAAIGVMRDSDQAGARPVLTLADVPILAERIAGARLDVVVEIDPNVASSVPERVQVAAYRIVQEALTNVVRHADARRAWVTVTGRVGVLTVRVEDDGHGPSGDNVDGHGLIGMRERADAVGGRLDAGLSSAGRFRVEARLPTRGSAR